MVPYMITQLAAYYDTDGSHYFVNVTTGGFGIRSDRVDLHYLSGLFCSTMMDTWFKSQAGRFHSGYFGANKQYLKDLPIKLPTTAEDKKLADGITESVRAIMDAKAKLRPPAPPFAGAQGGYQTAGLSDRETKILEAEIENHERRIDEAVFALYGVDGLPA